MSSNKLNEKEIRKVIKDKTGTFQYTENEIVEISEIIINDLNEEDKKHDKIFEFLAQYIHYSDEDKKYFFNLRRKQKQYHKEYTQLISKSFTNEMKQLEPNINKNEDENQDLVNESKEDQVNETKENQDLVNDTKEDQVSESEEENEYEGLTPDEIEEMKEEEEYGKKDHTYKVYVYPKHPTYLKRRRTDPKFGPFGTQWAKEVQKDDFIDTADIKRRTEKFIELRKIVLPEQRSEGWFKMRESVISASDGGTAVGMNKHEPQYNLILKKTVGSTFKSNKFCYHGKKLEEIATMIYQYRMNVTVDEFGLMAHPKIPFLGASPDGICNQYKLDGVHKSQFVGRMLEIKCPFVRKIQKTGPIVDNICPVYYWVQVQLQLECCDLDECDFWQCDIREYDSREEFIEDTDAREPFRSRTTGFEKGVLIQLVPKKRIPDIENGNYLDVIYEDAIFIYPPKIEMTPFDCDVWVAKTMASFSDDTKYKDYVFDKVIYWKLIDSFNVTINRDKVWFSENLPILENMWRMITFFRNNKDKLDIWVKYIDSLMIKKTKDIMSTAEKLCDDKNPNYEKIVRDIIISCDKNELNKKIFDEQEKKTNDTYNKGVCMFDD